MRNISIYDDTAKLIEKICDKYDMTVADLVDDALDEYADGRGIYDEEGK